MNYAAPKASDHNHRAPRYYRPPARIPQGQAAPILTNQVQTHDAEPNHSGPAGSKQLLDDLFKANGENIFSGAVKGEQYPSVPFYEKKPGLNILSE